MASATVNRIDPLGPGWGFGTGDVQIHDDRVLTASHHHSLDGLIGIGVDFLMRHVRWNEDEIARTGLVDELQMLAPAKSSATFHDIEDRFEIPVMVSASLGVRFNHN